MLRRPSGAATRPPQRSTPWRRSLQARLSLISLSLFTLILGFGGLTVHLFIGFNRASAELRTTWLPSTRIIGDLNNDTSDYRTAEGDTVLASSPSERSQHLGEAAELLRAVARDMRGFEAIGHPAEEVALHAAFLARWKAYLARAAEVTRKAAGGDPAEAAALYRSGSRTAYLAASDALGALTAHNVEQARQASARTESAFAEGRLLILTALVLSAALLAASLTFIRRHVSAPLDALAQTMRRLAASDTGIEIADTHRQDEIGEMARAVTVFRATAVDLIRSQRSLAQQAAMLEQKLALEQELTRQQRDFVSMISHEFRTPLTAIDAHAQRLINKRESLQPADLADRARRIRYAVQRITGLMENLLTTSRLIDGDARLLFDRVEVDLAALLREVCSFHRETSANASINEDFPASPLPVHGDPKLLFQVFSNLLSNAIKYSVDDAVIDVQARRQDARAILTVRDHGIGIPEPDLEKLFSRYHRGHNVAGMVGTGVGLYLAKTVIDLHGGTISVASAVGCGSCFTVVLPQVR